MTIENTCEILSMSYGAGINGTAMLVGFVKFGLIPQIIEFVDTAGNDFLLSGKKRGEKPETYDYIEQYAQPYVKKHLGLDITILGHKKDSLRASCFRNGTLPSKAYGFPGCSAKFKYQIMEAYEKKLFGPGAIITKLIGYHAEETRRSDITEKGRYRYRYPLREWGWGQQACVGAILAAGLPLPPKSACYFCPSSKPHEIIWLRDTHPDLFDDCLEMERNAEPYHQKELFSDGTPRTKGLGRKFSWSKFINITPAQVEELPEVDPIPCMCYDGGDDED